MGGDLLKLTPGLRTRPAWAIHPAKAEPAAYEGGLQVAVAEDGSGHQHHRGTGSTASKAPADAGLVHKVPDKTIRRLKAIQLINASASAGYNSATTEVGVSGLSWVVLLARGNKQIYLSVEKRGTSGTGQDIVLNNV